MKIPKEIEENEKIQNSGSAVTGLEHRFFEN